MESRDAAPSGRLGSSVKVLQVPADAGACRECRLTLPGQAASTLGVKVTLAEPLYLRHTPLTGELPVKRAVEDADVCVIHRPCFPAVTEWIPRLQAHGVAVVVDIDDDLLNLHPQHAWAKKAADWAREQASAAQLADLVTASTPALADRYAPPGRAVVLRNCVPAGRLGLPRASDGRTLGWGGSRRGHYGDLAVTGGAVADALKGTSWRFKVVGPAEGIRVDLGLTSEPDATGGLAFDAYQDALGSLDVGIAPLAAEPFNEAKSALRGLELAARGVPFVASPLPEFQRLAGEGIGLLASTPKEWATELRHLMKDPGLREAQAARGREVVAAEHTYETQAHRWIDAWGTAIRRRQEGGAKCPKSSLKH
jgi:glycosyltransferase involved in cell wall biosynthesis